MSKSELKPRWNAECDVCFCCHCGEPYLTEQGANECLRLHFEASNIDSLNLIRNKISANAPRNENGVFADRWVVNLANMIDARLANALGEEEG